MTAATVPAPSVGASTWTHSIRLVLVALVIAVLLATAFLLGRVTVGSTHHAPAVQPTTAVRPAPQRCGVPGIPC